MGNISSRSPYPGQFITLCFYQSWPFRARSKTSQRKTQAVDIHFLFIHPLFSFVVVRTLKRGYRRSKLVFFTKAPSSPWSHPHRLAHSGLCLDSRLETLLVTLMSVMAALSPCSRSRHLAVSDRHLAVSPLALLPAVSQPCSRSRRLKVSIVTLLSASSP